MLLVDVEGDGMGVVLEAQQRASRATVSSILPREPLARSVKVAVVPP